MASLLQLFFPAGGDHGQREASSSFTAAHCPAEQLSAPESYQLDHQDDCFKVYSARVLEFLKTQILDCIYNQKEDRPSKTTMATTHLSKNNNHLDSRSVLVAQHVIHECGPRVPVESRGTEAQGTAWGGAGTCEKRLTTDMDCSWL